MGFQYATYNAHLERVRQEEYPSLLGRFSFNDPHEYVLIFEQERHISIMLAQHFMPSPSLMLATKILRQTSMGIPIPIHPLQIYRRSA